jgi:hypothetical protein
VAFLGQKADDMLADLAVRPGDEHPHGFLTDDRLFMVLPPS